ncbi:MAG: hypothetical protein UR73_C0001G0007 [candidate division WS6 bacterium GW2011_GWF1_35_23]|uniref:AAA+ ATPase domain-containing protein n=1 Tax=candidate division WS6 bacterium GW2011_GWF1_35_23 TaxID=1619097 RepID=A0A0G0FFS9_9BACT|nr:MAG: hypothetical protein UR73_C0001G0007 [candidate division WS6 bacterium GW2011_GWF1_35_23]
MDSIIKTDNDSNIDESNYDVSFEPKKIDNLVELLNSDLYKNFSMLLWGPRRSGKTTFLFTLLEKLLKIINIDKSIIIKYKNTSEKDKDNDGILNFELSDSSLWILNSIIVEQKKIFQDEELSKKSLHYFIIFDDIQSTESFLKEKFNLIINTLLVEGRHINISIIITIQQKNFLQKQQRDNFDFFACILPFSALYGDEIKKIYFDKINLDKTKEFDVAVYCKSEQFIIRAP